MSGSTNNVGVTLRVAVSGEDRIQQASDTLQGLGKQLDQLKGKTPQSAD